LKLQTSAVVGLFIQLYCTEPRFPAGKNGILQIEYITACCSRSKKLDIKNFSWSATYI